MLFEHQREPEANEMVAFPARGREAFMAHWAKILGDETVVAMTVVVDMCVAGNVGCWTQDGQRLVGYWIGKEHWGKGVATQMLTIFLRLVADRPLHAHVAKHNVASIRVLEKCGFAFCAKATGALVNLLTELKNWCTFLTRLRWETLCRGLEAGFGGGW
jgi:RimJ/RimL family protein N-acetyltransferase